MMRNIFLLACASLFLASARASVTVGHEMTHVDVDSQSRRKTWDMFSFLLMMLGPHGCRELEGYSDYEGLHYGPIECHKAKKCVIENDSSNCIILCNKNDNHAHKGYDVFCNMGSGSSSGTDDGTSAVTNAYTDQTTPEGVVAGGRNAAQFEFWMLAVAASVGMALVAVHMGQRKEKLDPDESSPLGGAEVRGSVGRRVAVVSALADGVLGGGAAAASTASPRQMELSEYQLEKAPTYESAMV